MVDTRVKERLTGAIILVALLVLLVPELLTGPASSAGADHPPSADGAQMRSYTINLADDATARQSSGPSLAQTPMTSASDTKPVEAAANDAQPARDVAEAAAQSAAGAAARSEGSVQQAPPSVAASEPPARAVVTPAPRNEPAQRAAAERVAGPGWAVQVGSFASRENAERLARELKGKGFESQVSESSGNGKRLWRVRVGPAPDRAAAETLRTRLRGIRQSGAIVPMP